MPDSTFAYFGDASWVWIKEKKIHPNSYVAFRLVIKNLKLPGKKKCAINISASNIYLLYVNGSYLGRGPVRSWKKHIGIDTHAIGRYLKSGRNIISVLVHNYGVDVGASQVSRPGFLFQGHIANISLSTGTAGWECSRLECWKALSTRISEYFGFNEDVDMNKYHPEIWQQGRDGHGWQKPTLIAGAGKYWPIKEPRIIPYLAEKLIGAPALSAIGEYQYITDRRRDNPAGIMAGEQHHQINTGRYKVTGHPCPIKIPAGVTPYLIFDMGRITSGVIELDITTETAGTEIRIGYDQILYLDQQPLIEAKNSLAANPADNIALHLKPDHGGNGNSVDRLLLKHGRNRWRGAVNIRGFRYVKLSFSPLKGPMVINSVRCCEITYPVRAVAEFKCSDRILNEIWEAARLTTRLCLSDTFMDNPSRERQQYGGDGYLQALYTHYFFGDTRLWIQFLHMFPQGMRKDKAVQSGGPWPWNQIIPAWQLLWIESIREYVDHTGDNTVCPEFAGQVVDTLTWFVQFEDNHGLLNIPEKFDYSTPDVLWNFIDWQDVDGQLKGEAAAVTLNCMYCHTLATAAGLLRDAGQATVAARYQAKSRKIRTALVNIFKKLKPGTQAEHAIVYATLAGIISGKTKKIAEDALAGTIKSDIIYLFFTLKALIMEGRRLAALSLIRNIFGRMLADGSPTFYETICARQNPSRALCQGIGGVPGYFLPGIIAGINAINCRDKTVTLQPALFGLDWAETTFPCPDGKIQINIRRRAKGRKLEIFLPEGWKWTEIDAGLEKNENLSHLS